MKIGFLKLNKLSGFLLSMAMTLFVLVAVSIISISSDGINSFTALKITIVLVSGILSFQGLFTLFWMLYAWEDPEKMILDSTPKTLLQAKTTFSLLIPARFEQNVISKTIQSIANLNYPVELFEAFILCKKDDEKTIQTAVQTIENIGATNIKVLFFESAKTNKPTALNIGVQHANNELIAIFDAEDQPKAELLRVINTIYQNEKPAVIQSGVQLMNYDTKWFSALNVLEYYFWFKSALHLFSRLNVIPLGGNTIFFDKDELIKMGGWKDCLTEDAEIGIRFSLKNKKIRVVYDPALVTEEESPATMSHFLKQRSRWNQGFLQILFSGIWLQYKGIKKKLFALYFLTLPQLTSINLLFVFLSFFTFFIKLPIFATIVVLFPLYLLGLQLLTQLIGYYEFAKDFSKPQSPTTYIIIVLTFIPYQLLLAVGAVRATVRHIFGVNTWEKTLHLNLHRS